ncbi:MAG: hypothetical protein R2699_16205 [Acidimicrobiales bacterium]
MLDPVNVLYATAQTAALVGVPLDEFIGSSVLQYVTEDSAWVYAASVAMADDYADVTMARPDPPSRAPGGEVRSADLWAENRFDDPRSAVSSASSPTSLRPCRSARRSSRSALSALGRRRRQASSCGRCVMPP